jgi:hypothetical protein
MSSTISSSSYGGLIIPFDPFRLSQLAAVFGDVLIGKARNVLDAKLVVARHPAAPILLARIEGSVLDGDEARFWRENTELVAVASQLLPRQVFMFYVEPGPPASRREGFMVAQRGQVLAADEATHDRLPPNATESDWPVARLCEQLRISMDELAQGFPDGPVVEVKLVEPAVDDQALLMTLAGQPPEGEEGEAKPGASAAAASRTTAEEDAKRRAVLEAEDAAEQERRAAQVKSELTYAIDDRGLVVCPKAELTEPDILTPFIVSEVRGDLPEGLPRDLTDRLQGKRIDIAVKVDFLSEVFLENQPLSRPMFEERKQTLNLGGRELVALEVLGPRLGYGTLVSTGKAPHVFVSRKLDSPMPVELLLSLLEA